MFKISCVFLSEHNNDLEEEDYSSCTMPDGTSYSGDDWSYSLELTDEYTLDGEMGKRLNQMISIPVSYALNKSSYLRECYINCACVFCRGS